MAYSQSTIHLVFFIHNQFIYNFHSSSLFHSGAIKTTDTKVEFFFCNKHKIVAKPTMHREQNSAISKALLEKLLNQ